LETVPVFRALQPDEWGNGSRTIQLVAQLWQRQRLDAKLLVNSLMGPAERSCAALAGMRAALATAGLVSYLTGSGPTVFMLAGTLRKQQSLLRIAQRLGYLAIPCETIERRPVQVCTDQRPAS
jgi:4-diphosphocytidyl-2C-methyl-D-erythritol kinase